MNLRRGTLAGYIGALLATGLRAPTARAHFKRGHPCPSTGKQAGSCPGYTIDQVVPLRRGGADLPANMHWPPNEAARAKDKVE